MPKTVLLADDSVTIQKVVGISFASEDVALVTVDNGDDAITKAREVRPDVILADVVMPGKNGYEVCEAVKADPALQHIPVLLLTGTFEAFDEERARAAGAAAHVAKPFEAQTLIEQVNRLLMESRVAPAGQRPAAAGPPASAGQDDAFDFFDDEAQEVGRAETTPATTKRAAADPFDLETAEPFAFGDDVLTPAEAETTARREPAPRPPGGDTGDMTVAILGDDAEADATPLATRLEDPDVDDFLAAQPVANTLSVRDPGLTPSEEIFDFDFEESGSEPSDSDISLRVGADDLAQATVLDPDGAEDFDVSASDLGDPLNTELVPPPVAPEAPPRPARPESLLRPAQTAQSEPAARPEASVQVDPTAQAEAAVARLSPVVQEQLHATLEKIAWDALGNLSEEIVRKAVERVEQIAWEVIPQMAETLVREEIRRMKGDS